MTKVLLSTGGTGGHIFPILSLYSRLKKIREIEDIIVRDNFDILIKISKK